MPNLSTLSPITTTATALSNLVLVSPQKTIGYQPQNGIAKNGKTSLTKPALLFHYEGEQTVTLESDITDHFVEDNTAIQDQISLKPEIISTHGFIGELNDVAPAILAPVQLLANKLVTVGAYLPSLSITALLAYNEAFQIYQVASNAANSAIAAWSALTGTGGESVVGSNGIQVQASQTKQQFYFQQFYAYWRARTLFTVQTPWAVFQNMAIKSLRAIQDAETNVITDFEVSFKMIRLASTVTLTASEAAILQGRLANQSAGVTNQGTSTPVSSTSMGDFLSTGAA